MRDAYLRYLRKPSRKRGDRFVLEYIDFVHRLARRVVDDARVADDVTQDTFLKLLSRRPDPRSVKRPRTYVMTVAYNVARDAIRRGKTREGHEVAAAAMHSTHQGLSGEERVVSAETVQGIYETIDALPEELANVVHLRAGEGLSYQEIADITGVPPDTVGTRLLRAREELRGRLKGVRLAAFVGALESARAAGALPRATEGLSTRILERAGDIQHGVASQAGAPGRLPVYKVLAGGCILTGAILACLVVPAGKDEDLAMPLPPRVPEAGETKPVADRDRPDTAPAPEAAEATPPFWRRDIRISGRILDARDGVPLAEHELFLRIDDRERIHYLTSDATGQFSLQSPDTVPYNVSVGVFGYVDEYIALPAAAETAAHGDVTCDLGGVYLDPGLLVTVLVTDPDGTPIAGASVRNDISIGREGIDPERLGEVTRTDESGLWQNSGFGRESRVALRVSAEGYAARTVSIEPLTDTGPIPVVLESAGEVRGTLIDTEGRPFPGIALYIGGLESTPTLSDGPTGGSPWRGRVPEDGFEPPFLQGETSDSLWTLGAYLAGVVRMNSCQGG